MLKIQARADISAAVALHASLLEAVATDVVLDCADIAHFGAAMAQLWLACARTVEAANQKFTLLNVSSSLRDDLRILGFTDQLKKWENHA